MPPKRAVGRARRGPGPSTRRKNSSTLPAAEEDLNNGNSSALNSSPSVPSNADASVASSSTTSLGISDREVEKKDCAVSPKKATDLPSTSREPTKDVESGSAQTRAEDVSENQSGEDLTLSNEVNPAPPSTPKALCNIDQNPNSVPADVKGESLTSSEAKDKVSADVGDEKDSPSKTNSKTNAAVGGEEAVSVIEASDKGTAEGSGSSGGKKTKVVKKTIKVVKKIIKRVPKGSIKAGHQDSKIVCLGSPGANDTMQDAVSAPSPNSGEKEVQKLHSCASHSPIKGNTSSVGVDVDKTKMNMDSPGQIVKNEQDLNALEGSIKKETVQFQQNSAAEKSQAPTVKDDQYLPDAVPESTCLNSAEKKAKNLETSLSCLPAIEAEDGQKSMDSEDPLLRKRLNFEASKENLKEGITGIDQKSSAVNEDLQVQNIKNDSMEILDNKEKVFPLDLDQNMDGVSKDESNTSECLNEDERRKRGRCEVLDESNNAVKAEDENGDGTHYSVQVEAMERRKRRRTEIFIGGIDRNVKEEDIRKVFGQIGEVVDLRLPMFASEGKNKGFAFLRYSSAVDAKIALEKFSNVKICGKQCSASAVEGNDTIYFGNIDRNWKDEDVSKLLLGVGIEKIDTISVVKDPSESGRNRGFAFVEFETCKDAEIALRKLQRKDIFGKDSKFKVSWADQLSTIDESELLKVKTVYVEFIPLTWDEAKLREKFKDFGEIDKVVLAKNLWNVKRKDFAFISYKSREAAVACIKSLGHTPLCNDETTVNIKVSFALPHARGKQKKQVTNPSSEGTSKGKPKANAGQLNTKPTDLKRKGLLAVQRYGMHRPQHSANFREHRPEHSANFREHRPEQSTIYGGRGREQASRWPPPQTGHLSIGHPTTHSGGTHPVSAFDPGLVHSGFNRYPDLRLEASMHNNSSVEYMNGYSNYRLENSLPLSSRQYDVGYPHQRLEPTISASSRYPLAPPAARPTSLYSSRDIYAPGLPYSAVNHSTTEVEAEILRRSSLYRRY